MSRLYGGTGLGLVISQRLAERLGGRLWVDSEPGYGSAFHFSLRCRQAVAIPARPPSGVFSLPLAEQAARLPLRILLAEDNSINQRVGLLLLEKMGYVADVAGNGIEAVEALRRQPYDLILMDVQMPILDGLEATRRIRAELPPERQPRIVALTANVLSEQQEECLAAGMDDFVQKPVGLEDLQEALSRGAGQEGSPPPLNRPIIQPIIQPIIRPAAPPAAAAIALPAEASPLDPARLDSLRRLSETSGKPIVQTLVDTYLAETPRRIARMREALAGADSADLTFVAHSLKGISAQLGVIEVAAVSAEIERIGKDADLGRAAGLLGDLERAFERAAPFLELEREGARA
jgi:CheY-like chemotaxis protein/HPt (histidine-containing phosphotransfer) domain-containing protein